MLVDPTYVFFHVHVHVLMLLVRYKIARRLKFEQLSEDDHISIFYQFPACQTVPRYYHGNCSVISGN